MRAHTKMVALGLGAVAALVAVAAQAGDPATGAAASCASPVSAYSGRAIAARVAVLGTQAVVPIGDSGQLPATGGLVAANSFTPTLPFGITVTAGTSVSTGAANETDSATRGVGLIIGQLDPTSTLNGVLGPLITSLGPSIPGLAALATQLNQQPGLGTTGIGPFPGLGLGNILQGGGLPPLTTLLNGGAQSLGSINPQLGALAAQLNAAFPTGDLIHLAIGETTATAKCNAGGVVLTGSTQGLTGTIVGHAIPDTSPPNTPLDLGIVHAVFNEQTTDASGNITVNAVHLQVVSNPTLPGLGALPGASSIPGLPSIPGVPLGTGSALSPTTATGILNGSVQGVLLDVTAGSVLAGVACPCANGGGGSKSDGGAAPPAGTGAPPPATVSTDTDAGAAAAPSVDNSGCSVGGVGQNGNGLFNPLAAIAVGAAMAFGVRRRSRRA